MILAAVLTGLLAIIFLMGTLRTTQILALIERIDHNGAQRTANVTRVAIQSTNTRAIFADTRYYVPYVAYQEGEVTHTAMTLNHFQEDPQLELKSVQIKQVPDAPKFALICGCDTKFSVKHFRRYRMTCIIFFILFSLFFLFLWVALIV